MAARVHIYNIIVYIVQHVIIFYHMFMVENIIVRLRSAFSI